MHWDVPSQICGSCLPPCVHIQVLCIEQFVHLEEIKYQHIRIWCLYNDCSFVILTEVYISKYCM